MDEVEPQWHRGDGKGREIVGVVVVETPQAPGVSRAHVEAREHDAGVRRRPEEVHARQPLYVTNSPDGSRYHEVHQHGLEEVIDDQIEAVAGQEGARDGQRHQDEERPQPLRRAEPQQAQAPGPALIGQVQGDPEQAGDDCRSNHLQDREQLVNATHRRQDVTGDASEEQIPPELRWAGGGRGRAGGSRGHRRRRPTRQPRVLLRRSGRPRMRWP